MSKKRIPSGTIQQRDKCDFIRAHPRGSRISLFKRSSFFKLENLIRLHLILDPYFQFFEVHFRKRVDIWSQSFGIS